jgi:chromate transport protein ChrA
MGCLPLLLLFPLGFGIGYLIAGPRGALWGAGIGVLLGVLAMGLFIKALRRGHRSDR